MTANRREMPINHALCRPDHLWGVERKPVLLTMMFVSMYLILAFDVTLAIFALVMWTLVYQALRIMAKADPIMSVVYLRHIKYLPHYRAHSTPFVMCRKHYKGWQK